MLSSMQLYKDGRFGIISCYCGKKYKSLYLKMIFLNYTVVTTMYFLDSCIKVYYYKLKVFKMQLGKFTTQNFTLSPNLI